MVLSFLSILSYNVEDNLEPNPSPIPLVIMASEKTHDHIWDLLITNKFYGMKPEQIHLFKQVNTKFDFVAKRFILKKNLSQINQITHGPCEIITSKKVDACFSLNCCYLGFSKS